MASHPDMILISEDEFQQFWNKIGGQGTAEPVPAVPMHNMKDIHLVVSQSMPAGASYARTGRQWYRLHHAQTDRGLEQKDFEIPGVSGTETGRFRTDEPNMTEAPREVPPSQP